MSLALVRAATIGDEREEPIRTLANLRPDTMARYTPDCVRTYANAALARLTGLPPEALLGKRPTDYNPSQTARAYEEKIRAAARENRETELEYSYPDKDGCIVTSHIRLAPEHDADGAVVSVLALGRDITSYKQIEAQLRAREQEFRTLAENSPDCIVRYDRHCRRTYINPAYEKISGLPPGQALGTAPVELSYLSADQAGDLQRRLQLVLDSGIAAEIELAWQRPDGERMAQQILAVPERNAAGDIVSVLTMARDISALKEVERRLAEAEGLAHLGYWQWDARAGRASVSSEVCRIFGRPRAWQPEFQEIIDTIVEEDRMSVTMALRETFARQDQETLLEFRIEAGQQRADIYARIRIDYDALGKPARLSGTAQDVSELRRYQQQLHALSWYDPLTQLPNRELLHEQIRHAVARAMRSGYQVAIMILDLDDFKAINDGLGHGAGNRLLQDAARRLQQCVRKHDTVARLGGDEFALIVADVPPDADVTHIAQNILDAVADSYHIDGRELFVTGSMGIARFPRDGDDASLLLQCADAAMYHAKASGRNNAQLYSAPLTAKSSERLHLAANLRQARRNGELELHYQPQVDLATGRLIGAEALLRWNHPTDGMVPPDRFIGIAEETGLIVDIGHWVLLTACRAAHAWNQARDEPLRVAVNLSPRQFKTNDLVGTVERVLAETACAPEWLELEITESLLLDDSIDVATVLARLKDMGLGLAIDDFGTGYSALSYLSRFPIESLKIDRSFIRDMATDNRSAELVKAIIAMARSLRLRLVAEGIETHFQEAILQSHGCHCGQGYLYGKPVTGERFSALLKAE